MKRPLAFMLLLMLAGCASGPKLRDVADTIPPPGDNHSRIFFYGDNTRYAGIIGGAWRPEFTINGHTLITTPYGV